jgi:sulfur transfer complex TusBCD TusB component (DsrH family)
LVDDNVTDQQLLEDLRARGVEPEEVRPLVADLEDVFVELTYKRQQAEVARA